MQRKIAKLFVTGGSQAVRLPDEFRFDGVDKVYIRRDTVTGEVILSPRRGKPGWAEFFALRAAAKAPADFVDERPLNAPLKPRDPLAED